jgi:hypothetical protein
MRRQELEPWFDDLLTRGMSLPKRVRPDINRPSPPYVDEQRARAWATEAEAALQAVFPDLHACRLAWAKQMRRPRRAGQCAQVRPLELGGLQCARQDGGAGASVRTCEFRPQSTRASRGGRRGRGRSDLGELSADQPPQG